MPDLWLDMPPLDNHEVLAACCNRYKKQLDHLNTLYMACNDLVMLGCISDRSRALEWRWFYCYGALMMAGHLSKSAGEMEDA